jgi:hypothetical protein
LALVAGGVLIMAGWGLAPGDQVAAVSTPASAGVPAASATVATPLSGIQAAATSAAVPPGVTAAQWAQISSEIQAKAGGAMELQRLASYLTWSDALRQLREARLGGRLSVDLARLVDAGLDERVRQRELSAAEATRIKSVVLEATVQNPVEREQQLRQWAMALFPAAEVDPRQAPFNQRQTAIVAAWSARPPQARDNAALARELDALRNQSFAPNPR